MDAQRDLWGERSSIDLDDPDLSLHLHLGRGEAQLSLDGSGGSLHRRGYRAAMGAAPLKENLAAGLIRLTGWDGSQPLVDPCCGSGVLLIEAALAALQQAPGLERHLPSRDGPISSRSSGTEKLIAPGNGAGGTIPCRRSWGIEADPAIADQARANVEAAGLRGVIRICTGTFSDQSLPEGPGVLVCNPPYGQRIGDEAELEALYRELGNYAKGQAKGWKLWLLSGNRNLTGALRLKAEQTDSREQRRH